MGMEGSEAKADQLNSNIGNAICGIVHYLEGNTAVVSAGMVEKHPWSRKHHNYEIVLCTDIVM